MKKNLLFTFCFSFIPGAGQMYQKYMKRGLSIMVLASMFAIISYIFHLEIFLSPILVIMAFSFFDTYNIRNMDDEERQNHKDDYIWNSQDAQKLLKGKKIEGNKTLGIILILLGSYYIFDNVVTTLLYRIGFEEAANMISVYMPALVLAIASITVGIKMLKK